MAGTAVPHSVLRFDRYEVDLRAGRLSRSGQRVTLREKSFQILVLLLEHAGDVVTREELRQCLWPEDVFVDFDNNLNAAIASLRQALHDTADHPRFIETIPKHGYRFLETPTESSARTPVTRVRLVVLPFLNLSGDPAQDYFSDALTDEIITALAGLAPRHLAVIARTTAMYYKARQKDVSHIRRELGVDYVVEGAFRRTEDRVAINIQLIQTSDQTHLFAKKYDAPPRHIFDLQNCIAQAIAAHLPGAAEEIRAGQVAGDRVTRKVTEDLVAYNFYLMGRQQIQQCSPDPVTAAAKARRYLEDAVARDPGFALGHDGLAEGYWWLGFLGFERPKEAFAAGVRAARRALELDPTLGHPHVLLGAFHSRLDYNWEEAGREMALALQLDPTNPDIRFRYAEGYLLPQGRIAEAVEELERALESDPLSVFFRFWLGYAFYLGRKYTRALEQFHFLMELAPDRHPELVRHLDLAYAGVGLVRAAEGHFDEALPAFRKSIELSGNGQLPVRWGMLGPALVRTGQTAEARTLLERLEATAAEAYMPATNLAWMYFAFGDMDAGFKWLERAVEESDPNVVGINTYPALELLHSHPRFTALLRKMNLQP